MSDTTSVPSSATSSLAAVADLLGMLAYGELVAFDRMAADARLAPDLNRRALLSEMAAAEMVNYRRIVDRINDLGIDLEGAMAPFRAALADYHDQTRPSDWLEALTKAYVGDGIADDFFREVASFLPPADQRLVLDVQHDTRTGDFAAAEIRRAIHDDPALTNRLSMWARRLVGEGITQAQRVAAERETFVNLILAGTADHTGVAGLFARLTQAHTDRLAAVGLNA